MTVSPPSVLVLGHLPAAEDCEVALAPLLEPERRRQCSRLLIERALRWAHATAPGRVLAALSPDGVAAELAVEREAILVDAGAGGSGQDVAAACAVAFERQGAGPLLLVSAIVARLTDRHAEAALDDLAAGCDVSVGPTLDGRVYLVALARPLPHLFVDGPDRWDGSQLMARGLLRTGAGELSVGLLRAERALRTPADAAALAADPLTPPELRALL